MSMVGKKIRNFKLQKSFITTNVSSNICSLTLRAKYIPWRVQWWALPGRGSVCTWQSAYVFPHHDAVVLSLPAVFPLMRRSDRKRTWSRRKLVETLAEEVAVVSYRRRTWNSLPFHAGTGGEEEAGEEEEKGLARGEKNTGVLLSTAGNSAQPPPTGTSDESIDLGVGLKTPLSPAPLASARSLVTAPPPPCSSSALLSCLTSSLLLPFAITDIVLLTRAFPAFFFSVSRKWTKLEAVVRPLCPTAGPRIPGRFWRWMTTFARYTTFS